MNSATKMRLLRAGVLIFVCLGVARSFFQPAKIIGYSEDSYNGQVKVAAGSDPMMLVWATIAVAIFVLVVSAPTRTEIVGMPSMKRRAVAFIIDAYLSLVTLASIAGLIPLWFEAHRTGHFSWGFERDYAVAFDAVTALPIALLVLALMVFYFAFPLTRGSPTVGCFIMRLRVSPPFGDEGRFTLREALRRTFYEFEGLATWWRWGNRDSLGRTWYDRRTDTKVVMVGDE
jgi:hypothetical protein